MWRLVILRCLIALSWTIAGLSFGQVIYGFPHVWHSSCLNVAKEQMLAEGVDDVGGAEHWQEWYRRGDVVKSQLFAARRSGELSWLFAMCCGATTAVGLMIVFPGIAAAQEK